MWRENLHKAAWTSTPRARVHNPQDVYVRGWNFIQIELWSPCESERARAP